MHTESTGRRRTAPSPLRVLRVLAFVTALSLFAAACGSDDSGNAEGDAGPPATTGKAFDADCITVGTSGKDAPFMASADVPPELKQEPTVKLDDCGDAPKELFTKDLVEGTGPEVKAGSQVTVNYLGVTYPQNKEFDSSWSRGQTASFSLGQVIPGWSEGLVGAKVGSRRLLVIPPDKAYGAQGSPPDIGPNQPLLFVVDVVSGPVEVPEAISQQPTPEYDKAAPPPTELVTTDIVVGTGEEAKPGATVTVQYVGVNYSTGTEFDSSWSRSGQPATFGLDQVIKGWTDGIPGMKVGGRRQLIVPPDQAYGAEGRPPRIGPNETLVFVVDLLAVNNP
jgi:peptidylprolyl isomerase